MRRLQSNGLLLTQGPYPFVWRGSLTWSLYGRVLAQGLEAGRAVLRDRRTVGANTVCCSLMLSWAFPFTPASPGFWEMLTPFVHMAADEGMRVCFIVFADTRTIMPDRATQQAHWQRVYTHLASEDTVTLVLANQPNHGTQAIDPFAFAAPPSVGGFPAMLAARDNPLGDAVPTLPPWGFSAFCSKRSEPNWYMEAGCVSMWTIVHDHTHGPTILFEPPPCGRRPEWTDPGKWRQLARSLCFNGTCGGNFYSDFDARSEVYPPGVVRDSAVEFFGNIPLP